MSKPKSVTIVVPTYNSIDKMHETLDSLERASEQLGAKVIFVDDCSGDETFDRLTQRAAAQENWRVERLPANSGSAAAPRNFGLDLTDTEYVFFLDSDDVLLVSGLAEALEHTRYGHDVVRSALVVRRGDGSEVVADRIKSWAKLSDPTEKLEAVTRHQSLTCSFLMSVELLNQENIRFDPTRRIGEDIVFTAQVLAAARSVSYCDAPVRVYVRTAIGNESVTQRINSRQFADFVKSWRDVEEILAKRNVSFIRAHGYAAMNYALRQYVWFKSEPLGESSFDTFASFCKENEKLISSFPFAPRYRELLEAALKGDREAFNSAARIRMLIAGHDLKFLSELLPLFEEVFELRIDQWDGPDAHNEAASREALDWADLVWTEWMLGASVWYSNHLRSDQRMVVRAHRTEMGVEFGNRVNHPRVAAYVAIAPHTLGDFADRFDIPRAKLRLIPNAFAVEEYSRGKDPARRRKMAMVGILPSLKRFDLALELLATVRKQDPTVELHVFGKLPEELAWLMRDRQEREFYERCDALIDDLGLRSSVHFRGWVDTKTALAEVGAVVSLSDYEGMQMAIGEAYCSGALGLTLNWRGARACYPAEFIFGSVEELSEYYLSMLADEDEFEAAARRGATFMRDNYPIEDTWEQIQTMLLSIRA